MQGETLIDIKIKLKAQYSLHSLVLWADQGVDSLFMFEPRVIVLPAFWMVLANLPIWILETPSSLFYKVSGQGSSLSWRGILCSKTVCYTGSWEAILDTIVSKQNCSSLEEFPRSGWHGHWRGGLVVQRTCSSCRGPRFHSQHPRVAHNHLSVQFQASTL